MKTSAIARLLLGVACPLLALGCGRSGVETVAVEGTLTFGGQACPAGGTIYFVPISTPAGLPRRPGSAAFDKDGRFRATSFRPGDGLVPGKYCVRIECWRQPPTELTKGVSYVPAGYNPPEVTVERGTRGPLILAIDVPRSP
jgi:hypothetical protein